MGARAAAKGVEEIIDKVKVPTYPCECEVEVRNPRGSHRMPG